MARGKPFAVLPTRNQELDTVQRLVKDSFDQFEEHRRGMVISTVEVVPRSLVLSEQLVVIYTGKGGDTIQLPPASARGAGRGQVLCLANQGSGTVTLAPSGRDTLNGVVTVPVNGTGVFWSDGATRWHEVSALSLPNVGPGAGVLGSATQVLQTITLDAQGRVTAGTAITAWQAKVSAADTTPDFLDPTLLVSADLTKTLNSPGANETLTFGLANAGVGAGTIGSHSDIVVSVTTDAKGRVTAVGTENGLVTLSGALTVTTDVTARDLIHRRPIANVGTNLVAGDFVLSAGWGTTRSISNIVAGSKDTRGEFTVTSSGTGQAANPTIVLTFKDGVYPAAPFAIVARNGGTGAATVPTWFTLAGTLTITYPATPVAGLTYVFAFHVIG